jgi:hypothetical protein
MKCKMTRPLTLTKLTAARTIAVVGDVYRFLATGEETDGAYAIWGESREPVKTEGSANVGIRACKNVRLR